MSTDVNRHHFGAFTAIALLTHGGGVWARKIGAIVLLAFLSNSEGSEGCSGWVDSEVVGLSCRVHAWSLVIVVWSVMATIVVVVVLLLPLCP